MSIESKQKDGEPKKFFYLVCPKCGTKTHMDRKFCKCFYDLRGVWTARYAESEPVLLQPANIETPETNCERCGLRCGRCYSFSVNQKNSEGYGGADCEHKSESPRCVCCQELMRRHKESGTADYKPFSDTVAYMSGLFGLPETERLWH